MEFRSTTSNQYDPNYDFNIFDPLAKLTAFGAVAGGGMGALSSARGELFSRLTSKTIKSPYIDFTKEINKNKRLLEDIHLNEFVKQYENNVKGFRFPQMTMTDHMNRNENIAMRRKRTIDNLIRSIDEGQLRTARKKVTHGIRNIKKSIKNTFYELGRTFSYSGHKEAAQELQTYMKDIVDIDINDSSSQSFNRIIEDLNGIVNKHISGTENRPSNIQMKQSIKTTMDKLTGEVDKVRGDFGEYVLSSQPNEDERLSQFWNKKITKLKSPGKDYLTIQDRVAKFNRNSLREKSKPYRHTYKFVDGEYRRVNVTVNEGRLVRRNRGEMNLLQRNTKRKRFLNNILREVKTITKKGYDYKHIEIRNVDAVDEMMDAVLEHGTSKADIDRPATTFMESGMVPSLDAVDPTAEDTFLGWKRSHRDMMKRTRENQIIRVNKAKATIDTLENISRRTGGKDEYKAAGAIVKENNDVILNSMKAHPMQRNAYKNMHTLLKGRYPEFGPTELMGGIIKKYKKAFNLGDKDIRLGFDGEELVMEFDVKSILSNNFNVDETSIRKSRINNIQIKVPNFKGPLFVRGGRLQSGNMFYSLYNKQGRRNIDLWHFGEQIERNLIDDDTVKSVFNAIADVPKETAQETALFVEKVNAQVSHANKMVKGKVNSVMQSAKDIHNAGAEEIVLQATNGQNVALTNRTQAAYTTSLKRKVTNLSNMLSGVELGKYANSKGISPDRARAIMAQKIASLKHVIKGNSSNLEMATDLANAIHKSEIINISNRVTSNRTISSIDITDPANASFVPNLFSPRAETWLKKGQLSFINAPFMKNRLQPKLSAGTRSMMRPAVSAFGQEYGKRYLDEVPKALKNAAGFRMKNDPLIEGIKSSFPKADANPELYQMVDFGIASTEGNAYMTHVLHDASPNVEPNATVKLNASLQKKLLDALDGPDGNKYLKSMLKDNFYYGSNNEIQASDNVIDIIAKKGSSNQKTKLMKELGDILQKNDLVRSQDKDAHGTFVRSFKVDNYGKLQISYDVVWHPGAQTKLYLADQSRVLIHNLKAMTRKQLKDYAVSRGMNKAAAETMSDYIALITASKALKAGRHAPVVQGILNAHLDQIVQELNSNKFNIDKTTGKNLITKVYSAFLDAGVRKNPTQTQQSRTPLTFHPDDSFKVGKSIFGGTELQFGPTAGTKLQIEGALNTYGENIYSAIQQKGTYNDLRKKLSNIVYETMEEKGMSKEKANAIVKTISERLITHKNDGNMQMFLMKSELAIAHESPHELARYSKLVASEIDMIKDGVKWGPFEMFIQRQLGFDQSANYHEALHAYGRDYVNNYFAPLLEMAGYTDDEIEKLAPGKYPQRFAKAAGNQIPLLTPQKITAIKQALEKGTREEDLSFMKSEFKVEEVKDLFTDVQKEQKYASDDFNMHMKGLQDELNEEISDTANREWLTGSIDNATSKKRDEIVRNTLMTEKQRASWKTFIHEHRGIKLSKKLEIAVPGTGKKMYIDHIPFPTDVSERDFMSIDIKLANANGHGSYFKKNTQIPNRVHATAKHIWMKYQNGDYIDNQTELANDATRYYNYLLNDWSKGVGSTDRMPGYQQIGLMDIGGLDSKDATTFDSLFKHQEHFGKPLSRSYTNNAPKSFNKLSPGLGELMVSKENFVKMMKSTGMTTDNADKLAGEVIEGTRNFMSMVWRPPTKDQHSITPLYLRIFDSKTAANKMNATGEQAKMLSNAMLLNGIDIESLSGDVDRDIYTIVQSIVNSKDEEQAKYLARYIEEYGYKINKGPGKTQVVATSQKGKMLLDAVKKATPEANLIKGELTRETAEEIAKGTQLTDKVLLDELAKLAPEANRKRLDELKGKVITKLKDKTGINSVEDLYLPSTEVYKKYKIGEMLSKSTEEFKQAANQILGVGTDDLLKNEFLLRETLDSIGINGEGKQREVFESMKKMRIASTKPYLTVKAVTGNIYNTVHNKIWPAAEKAFGPGDKRIERIMEWGGVAQQINISSKHFFPAIAPDVISNLRKFSLNIKGSKEYNQALKKMATANYEGTISKHIGDMITRSVDDVTNKNKQLKKGGDLDFLKGLVSRYEGKELTAAGMYKPKDAKISLDELDRLLKIRQEILPTRGEDARMVKDAREMVSEVRRTLGMNKEQKIIVTQMHRELGEQMGSKHLFERILGKNIEWDANIHQYTDELDDFLLAKDGLMADFRRMFLPEADSIKEVPSNIRNLFTKKTATGIIRDKMDNGVKSLMTNILDKRKSPRARSISNSINKMGKGAAGLFLGTAIVGYLASQAAGKPADSWLGKTEGFGGELYDRHIQKADENMERKSQIESMMKTQRTYGELPLPKSYRTQNARVYIEPLPSSFENIASVMRGQVKEQSSTGYMEAAPRRISRDERLSMRVQRAISR